VEEHEVKIRYGKIVSAGRTVDGSNEVREAGV
jgi:hypothetical protein